MENISLDEDNNCPPELPDDCLSVGSSVSSTMENEYNDLIRNTIIVPQYENVLKEIKIPKVLENTLGLFSTRLIADLIELDEKKDSETVFNSNSTLELKLNENNLVKGKEEEKEIELTDEKEKDKDKAVVENHQENSREEKGSSSPDKKEEDGVMTIEKIRSSLEFLNDQDQEDQDDDQQENSTNETNKFDCLKSLTSVTENELSSTGLLTHQHKQQKQQHRQMEQYLHENYSANDEIPRQTSPGFYFIPASPPTNIDLEMNETSSLDTILAPSSNNNQPVKSVSAQFKPLDLNNNHLAKNVKIASCLDKWYKELKGHVLSEFEKSRLQMMQEQQKKLIEEKEKQSLEIAKLKKELDLLREQVKLYERKTLKKNSMIENLTKAFEKQCEKNDLQRVMMEWKLKRVESGRDDFSTKLADKYYNMRLKMKAFVIWYLLWSKRQKLKIEKACKKKAEDVCYDLATKYEAKIKKLDEELKGCKIEIDYFKTEMAKNEENMRKALMRGVCALNMEAMSIFNETMHSKPLNSSTAHPTVSSASMPTESIEQQEQQLFFNYNHDQSNQLKSNFIYHSNEELASGSSSQATNPNKHLGNQLNENDSQELAKRVKNYCEANLNSRNSQLNKAKQSLLSSHNPSSHQNQQSQLQQSHYLTINPNVVSHTKLMNSCNKIFDELSEHNLPPSKSGSSKPVVRSKIGSLLNASPLRTSENFHSVPATHLKQATLSTKTAIPNSNLPPHVPPLILPWNSTAYRSFVIEKHNNNNNFMSNTTASRVKYAPPGQPATVLNTIVNATAQ